MLRDSTSSYTPGISSRAGGSSTFTHSNIKNAEIQTDSTANWSGMRLYDAFGNIRYSQGWNGPFGYAGGFGYQEDATGLKLLGHRYYDPSTGRFLTRDPAEDGQNYYVYCDNNPLQAVDPDGQQWVKYNPGGWYWRCPFGSPAPASPRPRPEESVSDFQRRLLLEGFRDSVPPIEGGSIPPYNAGDPLDGKPYEKPINGGGKGSGGKDSGGFKLEATVTEKNRRLKRQARLVVGLLPSVGTIKKGLDVRLSTSGPERKKKEGGIKSNVHNFKKPNEKGNYSHITFGFCWMFRN